MATLTCTAKNAKGEPCKHWVEEGKTLCKYHDPDYAAKLTEDRIRGGKESQVRKKIVRDILRTDLKLGTIEDIDNAIVQIINEKRRGIIERKMGSSLIEDLEKLSRVKAKRVDEDLKNQAEELSRRTETLRLRNGR